MRKSGSILVSVGRKMSKLIFLVITLLMFLNTDDSCALVWSFPEHRYCNGGNYQLYICTDSDWHNTYWLPTCTSGMSNEIGNLAFLPMVTK